MCRGCGRRLWVAECAGDATGVGAGDVGGDGDSAALEVVDGRVVLGELGALEGACGDLVGARVADLEDPVLAVVEAQEGQGCAASRAGNTLVGGGDGFDEGVVSDVSGLDCVHVGAGGALGGLCTVGDSAHAVGDEREDAGLAVGGECGPGVGVLVFTSLVAVGDRVDGGHACSLTTLKVTWPRRRSAPSGTMVGVWGWRRCEPMWVPFLEPRSVMMTCPSCS